ncbi:PepSY-associated TM helix domain-containing protein [Caenimonas soli]|uniref:PepSY-associated TM helix domain-containing protein n=1 Tax=Caenimonas soli TaxID=2735555 RepID=UPI0015548402|nr:PepSY-associated TM helix domain-containing protein [Caenimonas soli]NPC57687.1 PepSY domain-containing protein [Caenimonas soli]
MKLAYQWHGRFGWVLAPLLAIQALGGAVLLWLQPLPAPQESPPAVQAWAQAVDQGVAELARRYPTAKIEYVNLPHKADAPVSVRLLASGSNESGWADIDAVRGTAGALQPDSSQVRTFLYGLHERLLLADAGPWVLRAMALAALVLVAMGLLAWWRVRHLPPRTPWRRVHRLVGPVVVLPVAMMLVTGFVLRSPDWARAVLSAGPGQAAAAPGAAAPAASGPQTATLGQALAAAATALPEARPIRIYPPRNGEVRVRMRGDEWHPIGLSNVFVSATDASVRRIVRATEQPLSVRYLNVVYPLHLGWLPGSPGVAAALLVRGLWTLIALALAGLALTGAVQRFRTK